MKIFFTSIVAITSITICAQTYQKTYQTNALSSPPKITEANGSVFLAYVEDSINSSNVYKLVVQKNDVNGAVVFKQKINIPNQNTANGNLKVVDVLADANNIYVTGNVVTTNTLISNNYGISPFVLKVSQNGTLGYFMQYAHVNATLPNTPPTVQINSSVLTGNGDIVSTGVLQAANSGVQYLFMLRTNANTGTLIKEGYFSAVNSEGYSIAQSGNSSLYLIGRNINTPIIAKISNDNNLNVIAAYYIPVPNFGNYNSLNLTQDFVYVATTSQNSLSGYSVALFDTTFSNINVKSINNINLKHTFSNGVYSFICGTSTQSITAILKLNNNFSPSGPQKTYSNTFDSYQNGFANTTTIYNLSVNNTIGLKNIQVVKTDINGNTLCSNNYTTTFNPQAYTGNGFSFGAFNSISSNTGFSVTSVTETVTVIDECLNTKIIESNKLETIEIKQLNTDEFYISSEAIINEILVYDITGKIIKNFKNINANAMALNFEKYSSSMFLLKVDTELGRKIFKIIKN